MCLVYNQPGSLSYVLEHLKRKKIYEFDTLNDIVQFQESITYLTNNIIDKHRNILLGEKNQLKINLDSRVNRLASTQPDDTSSYENSVSFHQFDKIEMNVTFKEVSSEKRNAVSYYLSKLLISFKQIFNYFQFKIDLYKEKRQVSKMLKRYQFLETDFDTALQKSSHRELKDLNQRKEILNSLSSFIAGAYGEQRVIEICSNLPDDFILINDFKYRFSKSIYYRHADEYIKSVQIDHLLITPAGIFVIETKNWSQQSFESSKYFSPVLQLKRAGFAMYTIFGLANPRNIFSDKEYNWGDVKIPIRNILLLINNKPSASFDFVKMLHQNELIGYVKSFTPIITREQALTITNFLLHISDC